MIAVAVLVSIGLPASAEDPVTVTNEDEGSSSTVGMGANDPGSAPAEPVRRNGSGRAPAAPKDTAPVDSGKTAPLNSGSSVPVDNYDPGNSSRPAAPRKLQPWEKAGATEEDLKAASEAGVKSFVNEEGKTVFSVDSSTGDPDAWWAGFTPDAAPAQEGPAAPPAEPEEPAEPAVDPAVLAQTATEQMGLEAPYVESTPDSPDVLGAVGLPVWFWVNNPGPTTTGPQEETVTAGSVSVTATATFSGMTIQTGDGSTVECSGPGTEYPGTGIEESPDCGYVYEQMSDDQPDGTYTVDITAHWTVQWESTTGESGEIPVDLTTDKQLRIGQYQSVVTDVS